MMPFSLVTQEKKNLTFESTYVSLTSTYVGIAVTDIF